MHLVSFNYRYVLATMVVCCICGAHLCFDLFRQVDETLVSVRASSIV